MTASTTPRQLNAMLEGDTEIRIGDRARHALRREQLESLATAQTRVEAAFLALPELNGEEARGALEELAAALSEAKTAAGALWWLAPAADGEVV